MLQKGRDAQPRKCYGPSARPFWFFEDEPPLFGWFCNNIVDYPECLHLQAQLHLRNDGKRPSITLRASEHPLFLEQRDGITLRRVEEIAAPFLRH